MSTDRRQLAEKIARDLFVNGSGEKAQRLVLTVDGPSYRDLGGWSEEALADRIEDLLESGDPGVAVAPRAPLPDHDNHHNALLCPHCNPKGLKFADPGVAVAPKKKMACINCGEDDEGLYETSDGNVSAFCAQCWEFLREEFQEVWARHDEDCPARSGGNCACGRSKRLEQLRGGLGANDDLLGANDDPIVAAPGVAVAPPPQDQALLEEADEWVTDSGHWAKQAAGNDQHRCASHVIHDLATALRAAVRAVAPPPSSWDCHKLDTAERVFFYEQDFYVLSNFSAFRLEWKGLDFDTSEAAYHWEKLAGWSDLQECILHARSAHEAFKFAESQKAHRIANWDDVKVDIMRDILRAKANQHEYVRRKLLATGTRELIEDSWRDDFWGWGPNRDGQNMLGKLWMQIRNELRAVSPPQEPPS